MTRSGMDELERLLDDDNAINTLYRNRLVNNECLSLFGRQHPSYRSPHSIP